MNLPDYMASLGEDALREWASGTACEVMADHLHAAVGVKTAREMAEANGMAQDTANEILARRNRPMVTVTLPTEISCWGDRVDDDEVSDILQRMEAGIEGQFGDLAEIRFRNGLGPTITADDRDLQDEIREWINNNWIRIVKGSK